MADNAQELARLLEGRDGWRLETDDAGPHWLFGTAGAARLAITAEMDGFLMYRADEDTSWVIPQIDQVEAWLNEHEQEHAGLSPLQKELQRAIEEAGNRGSEARGQD